MSNPSLLLIPAVGYLAAAALLLWGQLKRIDGATRAGWGLGWALMPLHALLLGLRFYEQPAAPLTAAREFAILLSLLLVITYQLTARLLRGVGVGEVVLTVAGALLLATAPTLPVAPATTPPILASVWLLLHVPLLLLADLMYALAGSGAAMYLVVSGLLKARRPLALLRDMPTLDSLERFSHQMAGIGFPLLTAGIMTGMIWSHEVWGQLVPETPKQLIALVTWGLYAAYFHARLARGIRGRSCAWLLVAGLVLVVAGLFIPVVTPGPHKFI